MHVQTMQMDPRIARIHYRDYLQKVREHRDVRLKEAEKKIQEGGKIFRAGRLERSLIEKEDEELMKSFRAMARGERIINVHKALQEGGLNKTQQLPNLALAHASWKECWLTAERWATTFAADRYTYGKKKKTDVIKVGDTVFGANLWNSEWRRTNNLPQLPAKALVPAIPAHFRPSDLDDYYILWEAEWTARAPEDPILLKKVTDNIYAVVAQWDLTPIEQAVLEGRLRS